MTCSSSILHDTAGLHGCIHSLHYLLVQQSVTGLVAHTMVASRVTVCEQAGALHAADRQELLRRVHNLERHMRENKLRFTFTDALGRAQDDANDQATSMLHGTLHTSSLKW